MNALVRLAGPRIAALSGASSAAIQALLADFAGSLQAHGLRVAGLVEIAECRAGGGCGRLAVRDLATGEEIAISQDLGAGSTACNLDPGGLARACAAAERAIALGVDVVVLSKFGKLEAARGGLSDAFRAAIAADVPVVTAVAPAMAADWARFAGPLSDNVEACAPALAQWWRAQGVAAAKDAA